MQCNSQYSLKQITLEGVDKSAGHLCLLYMEWGVGKNLDLMRGVYENIINWVRGGSTKIKLMEPEMHVYNKRYYDILKDLYAQGGSTKKHTVVCQRGGSSKIY